MKENKNRRPKGDPAAKPIFSEWFTYKQIVRSLEGVEGPLEDTKIFEAYHDLPDGYQVQLMVLQDFPGGRQKRGLRMDVFRSRIWIGQVSEPEPLAHRSQEHPDLRVAIDACYSLLLSGARSCVNSPEALAEIERRVDEYFCGKIKAILK